jgi:LmbE family N-acetylglucosaminyl deacetylase
MHGEGFPGSRHQSLHKLLAGSEAKITTVDGHSSYTGDQLTQALAAFLEVYSPDEVHLQTTVTNAYYADHSDHGAASAYGSAAVQLYQAKHPGLSLTVRSYVGYPVHGLPENVADGDLQIKQAAFLAYAAHDGAVCHSLELCYSSGVYGIYLSRQYTAEEYEQAVGGM